jgi:hypothetical protein
MQPPVCQGGPSQLARITSQAGKDQAACGMALQELVTGRSCSQGSAVSVGREGARVRMIRATLGRLRDGTGVLCSGSLLSWSWPARAAASEAASP